MSIAIPSLRAAIAVPSWTKNELWRKAHATPSLDLRFADSRSLVDATSGENLVTFTRASSGTYVGSDGLIKTAVTNLVLQSEDFSTTWGLTGIKSFGSGSIVNATTAPNGSSTADLIVEDTSNGGHFTFQVVPNIVSGTTYTASAYIKPSALRGFAIGFSGAAFNDQSVRFNYLGQHQLTVGAIIGYTITPIANWFKVSITAVAGSSGNGQVRILLLDGTGVSSYLGDGSSGLYVWGAQLEQSSTVGEYIPTTSTVNSAPRFDHDPTTGESLGLLVEESRTNLVTNSSAVGAATGTPGTLPTGWGSIGGATGLTSQISGIGTEDGIPYVDFRFFGTTGSNFLAIVPAIGVIGYITNTAYTASIYTKLVGGSAPSGFSASLRIRYNLSPSGSTDIISNFSILNTGSLISNRVFSTGTTTGTLTGAGLMFLQLSYSVGQVVDFTIRVGYPQLEQGSFATSVIPTYGSEVTRSADVASISGSNFSSWYRQDEGTVFARYDQPEKGLSLAVINDGTNSNSIVLFGATITNQQISANMIISAANQGRIDAGGSFVANATSKVALATSTDGRGLSCNGSAVTASASPSSMPTLSELQLQGSSSFTARKGGHIARFAYWPQRLPNDTLQTITQ